MYLIIDSQYRISKALVLTGAIRAAARAGEISLIDLKTMKGMNSLEKHPELGEWSDIQDEPA